MRSHAKAPSAGSIHGHAVEIGRAPALLAVLLAVAVAALAFASAPAHAAKGWALKETFGSVGKPEFGPALSGDQNMAVDRSSGDLLVYNNSDLTLSRWHADGTPSNFSGLGTNVIDGKRGPGGKPCVEEAASCDETPGNAGIGGTSITQIAVDNSGTATDGNIYVSSESISGRVDIFSDAGALLGQLTTCPGGPSLAFVAGVAVDESGSVYVGANESSNVSRYDPSGNPPVNADCVASTTAVFGPGNLAVGAGPSAGHVFVTRRNNDKIFKLDAALTKVEYSFGSGFGRQLTVDPVSGHVFHKQESFGWTEYDASGATAASVAVVSRLDDAGSAVHGLAVAEGGETLYVSRGGTLLVHVYEAVPIPEATVGLPSVISGAKATVTGVVNPEGVAVAECFFEYGKTTSYGSTEPCNEVIPTDESAHPVSADLSGLLAQGTTYHYRLVVKAADGQDVSKNETFVTADTYTTDPASGIAQTEATVNGTVRPEGVALTGCRFEWGLTTDYGEVVPCVPAFGSIPNDDADHAVSAALGGLQPSTTYHYRLVAENSLGQIVAKDHIFSTQGLPAVDGQMASALGQSTATLQAWIHPFGTTTEYHFEWGTDASYGNRFPATGELPAGSGDQTVRVTALLSGLAPASGYHFRLVASNSFGTTEGPDQRFETLNQHGLPDERAFELVTPVDKGASGAVNAGFTIQISVQPAADGNSVTWPLQNGTPETSAGGYLRLKASRGEGGWSSAQLSAPSLIAAPELGGLGFALPSSLKWAAEDLRCGLLESFNPITADTPAQSVERGVTNLYLWREDGDGVSYELISDRVPLNPEVQSASTGEYYTQIEAAEDCGTVYFTSLYRLIGGASGLYEWEEGTLRDAGVRPDGSVGLSLPGAPGLGGAAPVFMGGELNFQGTSRWNAVSPDGRRLFFTARSVGSGKPAVFMREDGVVTEISESQTAVQTNGARFETASPDGSRVFFRANHGIAGPASHPTGDACGPVGGETVFSSFPPLEAKACDLYVYDAETGELSDLSPDANPGDPLGAAIQGAVAVDEDGSHAYFTALGQLIPGKGRTYAQNLTGSANVYLHREGGPLSYVTTLRRAPGDLFSGATMRTGGWRAETSADGSRLLFESSSKLTGWYDNEGRKLAYLYDADTGEVACLSCRPDGEPPASSASGALLSGPDLRSLSEDGSRAFFTSRDALIAGAPAGRRNLYKWEEGQVYFLASADAKDSYALDGYRGSSADGSSVFLATDERLAPQDRDFVSDVYAVREDGGFPFVPEPPECQVEESIPLLPNQIYCQGDPSARPADAAASTAGIAGAGNVRERAGNRCARSARRAQALSKRAKALRRSVKSAPSPQAARRIANRARRAAKAARRNSNAAKRCRQRARQANIDRGGSR